MRWILAIGGVVSAAGIAWSDITATPPLGTKIEQLSLVDVRTERKWSIVEQARDAKGLVVVFLGTECPVSNLYLPKLAEMDEAFRARGVRIVGINSNRHDTAKEIAAHAAAHKLAFPVLQDAEGTIAERFHATRHTECFVLDANRVVRYRGRIDDQFDRNLRRNQATSLDLRDAVEAVLSNREVPQPVTAVVACPLNLPKKERAIVPTPSRTYTQHVAGIVQSHCTRCHRPGEIGPFSLLTYQDAVAWSGAIREVVADRQMPPWFADPQHGSFENDRRLSDSDRETLLTWIDQGCPQGNPDDLPAAPKFVNGWRIGKPDQIVAMNTEVEVPAQAPAGGVPYRVVRAGEPFAEERWVQAAEVRPGNRGVVHHVLVYMVLKGQTVPGSGGGGVSDLLTLFQPSAKSEPDILTGFAPGDEAYVLPAGIAKRVPKGAQLVFEMHYTPNGKACTDRSTLGLIFAKEPPEHELLGDAALNWSFAIPPGAAAHSVSAGHTFKSDVRLLSMTPHMHLRGKSFKFSLTLPSGNKETLLWVPKYDFNWQLSYILKEPRLLPKGSRIDCVGVFDNSPENPHNPDPSQRVKWGEQTWEEMMIGFFDYYEEKRAPAATKR